MDDGALRNRLDGILLLLLLMVSLLLALVFGRGYGDRLGITVASFFGLGVVLLGLFLARPDLD